MHKRSTSGLCHGGIAGGGALVGVGLEPVPEEAAETGVFLSAHASHSPGGLSVGMPLPRVISDDLGSCLSQYGYGALS